MPPRKKNVFNTTHRTALGEDMYVSTDDRGVRRGRRSAPRTEVFRPCLIWRKEKPETKLQGVVLDLNAYGLMLRTLHSFPMNSLLVVQLMRDEDFRLPLSGPLDMRVARVEATQDGFTDYGLEHQLKDIPKNTAAPTGRGAQPVARRLAAHSRTRMHLVNEIEDRRMRR